ncbi:MAG: RNA 2',3'-cyclic phosphodiesterase [Telluria sp.]
MRCFLAAWPDATARQRFGHLIEALRAHAEHGRVMRPENLHLTLAFIGDLPDAMGAKVAAACAAWRPLAFEWRLDEIGFFARPRVLWAGGPLTPALGELASGACALLDSMQVGYDRKPFVPHVTLLRDVRRFDGPRAIAPPIDWPIREVALYRSGRDDSGARYFRVEPA